ncbi:UvrD-helicase domain-containing protein [Nocardioides sp. Kera G14]|uniref:UvrD-helicase domain-containing protein n=1 Tax=Nocardioides sp. Kera G14 TaxID=2884264 RepID=UPI001D1028A4|nr:UvrD-helicase domain-containing protein [Nocardioides sp. Kera G14]UDY25419.1 UvrD-helicase domain-containing protein [Nocardioides sp. Kera G14]
MVPFDLAGPLPTGTTLLEASAGTGKTFALATLVTRYVAEGVATLDQMLVITFGRAATQELRERVREHLVVASRTLEDPVQRRRVLDALASFDGATIATTHQFCQIVLRSLGVAGDSDPGTTLVDSVDDLVVEIVDDLYLGRYGSVNATPPISRDVALTVARAAVEDSQSVLAPSAGDAPGEARVSFACAVRDELERRKRRLGILSYDDLLSRLADALSDEHSPARLRMRERWRIVLVDEFQDTDPVQWQVLSRAFDGHATLVLIGDPKQAIYGFRGGDVATYLAAASTATTRATLAVNWRTDADLISSLRVVLDQAQLGDPEIAVLPIEASRPGTRLVGAGAPWRMRQVRREGFKLRKGDIAAADARSFVARDCAADIARVLSEGASWDGEPVRAGQIAVIVSQRAHGALVARALAARGVPAVTTGGGDVFQTEAADAWCALLEALESPHRTGLVRAAAVTPFFGLRASELVAGGESLTASLADTLRGWALLLRGRGVAALVEAAEERGLTARILGQVDGDRLLTDLRHLGQLLHDVQTTEGFGLTGLLEWFRDERRRVAATERPRRLDSDAAAVQIVTIWGSKGLEYPITYLPFAYDNWVNDRPDVVRFHDRDVSGLPVRSLDVSGSGAHLAAHLSEGLGEELRTLYVALTRAQSQVVTWWAPTFNTPPSGLHRLLFGRRPGTAEVPERMDLRDDDGAAAVFTALAQMGGPSHEIAAIAPASAPAVRAPVPELAVRRFDRSIDLDWKRTSYSALIRVEETVPSIGSEAPEAGKDDEPDPAESAVPSPRVGESLLPNPDLPDDELGLRSPMADLPAGAGFGSLVHAVLEHADPEAPDFRAELVRCLEEQLRWWPVDASVNELADGLLPLNQTSLGPVAGGLSLLGIPLRDRLRELDFEIPLTGGDETRSEVRLRDLAGVLRQHLPADDPLSSYADRLESPALGDQLLRGYLSGSIDVVLRLPGDDGGRFVIVDYKTNFLGETVGDYTQPKLAEAMLHSHYPLQAMLYGVVLHRYLSWRLPLYSPERHLGGVLYLYVRGMAGAETPVLEGDPTGVFRWEPPASLIVALSELIEGETP